MLTSQDIANKKLDRSTLGGYRTDDVDGFLNQVASTIDQLEEQNSILTKKLEVLADKLEEYRNDEDSLRAALIGAQKLGDSVIRESKSKAEIILRDATIKAERLVAHASDQVEKEKLIYIKLQKDVAAFKNKLLATYKQHLEIVSSLPEDPFVENELIESAPAPQKRTLREEEKPSIAEDSVANERAKPAPPEPVNKEQPPEEDPQDAAQKPEQSARRRAAMPKFSYMPKHTPSVEPEPDEDTEDDADYDNPSGQADPTYLNLTAEEYYEAFEDDDSKLTVPKKQSKFGTLKFGAGYDLKR